MNMVLRVPNRYDYDDTASWETDMENATRWANGIRYTMLIDLPPWDGSEMAEPGDVLAMDDLGVVHISHRL